MATEAPAQRQPPAVPAADNALPLRMLVQWVYCPRLFYLMHVEGQMDANEHVWRGRVRHRRVDTKTDRAARRKVTDRKRVEQSDAADAAPGRELPETWRACTSLDLGSDRLGLVGRLDTALLSDEGHAVPAEMKSGAGPASGRDDDSTEQGAWVADAVHVMAQGLLLEDAGHQVPHGELYYARTRRLLRLELTQALRQRTLAAIRAARETERAGTIPPPLVDSPKCSGCSLATVCLPEETAWLRAGGGELSDPDAVEPPVRRVLPAHVDEADVLVLSRGSRVRKEAECIRIDLLPETAERDRLPLTTRVPLSGLQSLAVGHAAQITTQAIVACMEAGVPVSFVSPTGRLRGVTIPAFGNNVQLRIAQHEAARDESKRLGIARAIVAGKLRNQRTILRRNVESLPETVLEEFGALSRSVEASAAIDELMGLEGRGARLYFEHFGALLEQRGGAPFAMDGRNRRPPRDRANALLSFGYGILTRDLTGLLFRIGFDPMIGFLHASGYGRPALALDLMEEFRPLIVDSTVLRVVSQRMVTADGFRQEAVATLLTPATRRAFAQAIGRRKDELVTHPVFGYRISYLRTMEVQARLLARLVQGEIERYPPMTTR